MNPFEGLKHLPDKLLRQADTVGIPMNPFEGLKHEQTSPPALEEILVGIPMNPFEGLKRNDGD